MAMVNNPHDKFFKETFSNIEIARSFIENYLPEKILHIIDAEKMKIVKDSFVDRKLRETFSDLLYEVEISEKPGYIYILFEHKSYPYRLISLQLLRYMTKIWDLAVKQNRFTKKSNLPIIIPLVFYHGKESWNIEENLSSLITELPVDLEEYVPDFRYILYDLSNYSDAELRGTIVLKIFLEIVKYIFADKIDNKLEEIFGVFKELESKDTGMEYFETVIRYLLNTREDLTITTLKDIADKTLPERSGYIMTLADRLREEGKHEGIKEGIKEGRKEALEDTISVLLHKKLSIDSDDSLQEKIKSLNIKKLQKIIDNIFEITSLDDLEEYL